MKKVLLLVSALLIVFSGVAAVSAYEGHLVNVKAHVENAIGVSSYHVDYGVVFPEEAIESQVWVGLSESFRAQTRYSSVLYKIYWEPKPIPADAVGVCDPDNDDFYTPIWDYITLGIEGDTVMNPPVVDDATGLPHAATGTLYLSDDICDLIHLILDPPVFDKFYNAGTDPRIPSGILVFADDEYCLVWEDICGTQVQVPHADLGGDLKVQVIDVVLDVPAPAPIN